MPGGIDAHTHLDMPFGGTTSTDDFETGTRAAAFGGTTSIVDFAIQARGTRMRDALDTWWKKGRRQGVHRLRPAHDRHRSGRRAAWKTWTTWCAKAWPASSCSWRIPNVLMVDDATIFKALSQTAKNGALICMHAENGSVIDVIVQRALAEGKTAPDLSRADAAAARRSGGRASRDRDGGDRGRAGVHRASVVGGRAERSARGARSRRAGVRRDLSAVPAALDRRTERAEFRRREVRVHAAAAPKASPAETVGRA